MKIKNRKPLRHLAGAAEFVSIAKRLYRSQLNSVYSRLVKHFYGSMHKKCDQGFQLSLPGLGRSRIESIYIASFQDSLKLADRLITAEHIRFEIVYEAFKLFYENDNVGRLCGANQFLRDSFSFSTLIINKKFQDQAVSTLSTREIT